MKTYTANSFAEFHNIVWDHRPMYGGLFWIYRGQSKSEWPLIPKAGRPPYNKKNDLKRLTEWKENALPYLKKTPDSEWEWLALAQHYGFATRLLDWSFNPLIALFFCVTQNEESDGAVYIHFPQTYVNGKLDPVSFDGKDAVVTYKPNIIDTRIKQQSAIFTFHGTPHNEMTSRPAPAEVGGDDLYKVIISKKAKQFIKIEIDMYGINDDFVFPGLEGVSKYINRRTEGIHIRKDFFE